MTDTTTTDAAAADRALKARHRTMWGLGDYPDVAARLIAELGPTLVAAAGRVLDIAAGTGNVAVPAALAGADVVASDLTPELFEAGRAFAERQGVTLRFEEGDVVLFKSSRDSDLRVLGDRLVDESGSSAFPVTEVTS